jgi:hypothetical protein
MSSKSILILLHYTRRWKKTTSDTSMQQHADMLYVYGFCDGSATATVEEYRRRFPILIIPDRRVFSKLFSTFREDGTLPSAHISSERARQHMEEQENILDMIQRSSTTSMRGLFTRLSVSQTRVRRTLHDALHPQRVQNLHRRGSAMRLEFSHWLHINCQLLPLMLFTDEATFTRNGINNTRNSYRQSHENPHVTVETNFQRRFSVTVWCGMIDET